MNAELARRPIGPSTRAFSLLGVFAAVVLAVNANVLVARFYERWDVTRERLYTLSHATRQTLASLPEPISVTVLLSRADPLLPRVRQMLTAYAAETTQLEPSYVDPEQSPAEFEAVRQKYGILAGKAEDGRVVTDAVIVIARGERTWFVTADDVTSFDDEGHARPRLEQALTEGIANVLTTEQALICFAEGHQEASPDDAGPEGLAELRHGLDKNNFEISRVNLEQPDSEKTLSRCRALLVVGPEVAYSSAAAGRAVSFVRGGGSAALFASALFGEDTRARPSGLEPLAELSGVELERNIVLEADPSARLPRGAGEVFFAVPKAHEVTSGLVRDDKVDFRVLLSEAQSLKLKPEGTARELLLSSAQALAVSELRPLLEGKELPPDTKPATRTLAVATELAKPPGSSAKYGPRLVVVGAANPPHNRSFHDPALLGDRLFTENALAWLTARPALVSVPDKASYVVGLALTEDDLGEVLRYVLVYMPGVATLLGVLLMLDRRKREKRGRAAAQPEGESE